MRQQNLAIPVGRKQHAPQRKIITTEHCKDAIASALDETQEVLTNPLKLTDARHDTQLTGTAFYQRLLLVSRSQTDRLARNGHLAALKSIEPLATARNMSGSKSSHIVAHIFSVGASGNHEAKQKSRRKNRIGNR